jgi:hypothetical protein
MTKQLIFASSLLSTQYSGVGTKPGYLRIRIMCLNWGDMSTGGRMFRSTSTNTTMHAGLIQIAHLSLNNEM